MFDFKTHVKAETIDQAVRLLKENPDAKLIAGGTDILIKLKQGKKGYENLVDIHDIKELKHICLDNKENILIGSGVVFSQIMESGLLRRYVPLLCEAAGSVGGPQIRNIATIGGNVCNGVPSADSAPGLFALNALVLVKDEKKEKEIPIARFYKGPGRVELDTGQMVTGFKISFENYHGYYGHYYKYAMRNAMDIATIGCAVSLKTKDHVLTDYRLSFGVAGPVPLRCPGTEKAVINQKLSQGLLDRIFSQVEKDVAPRTSWRASREFRLHIIKELSNRVTRKALQRAGEEI